MMRIGPYEQTILDAVRSHGGEVVSYNAHLDGERNGYSDGAPLWRTVRRLVEKGLLKWVEKDGEQYLCLAKDPKGLLP